MFLKFTNSMIADLIDVIGIEKYNELCEEHVIHFEKSTQIKIRLILNDMEKEWNAYNIINHLHIPFSTFVRNEKIMYAQRLLSGSKMSITEIAAESGFSSNAYFSDCFKRNAGISPIQFRKENGNV